MRVRKVAIAKFAIIATKKNNLSWQKHNFGVIRLIPHATTSMLMVAIDNFGRRVTTSVMVIDLT